MKFIFSLVFAALLCVGAFAQDDYNKGEVFTGYSHGMVDGSTFRFARTNSDFGKTGPLKFHGFNAAGVYNLTRYVGIRGDVSGTFHNGAFTIPIGMSTAVNGDAKNSLYNVLGGVQVKDNVSRGVLSLSAMRWPVSASREQAGTRPARALSAEA